LSDLKNWRKINLDKLITNITKLKNEFDKKTKNKYILMKEKQTIVSVLGSGNMGTALAKVLSENVNIVKIWNWEGDREPLRQIIKYRENKKYLKGFKLANNIFACFDLNEVLKDSEVVFLAVPSSAVEKVMMEAAPFLSAKVLLVDSSKGIDKKNGDLIIKTIDKNIKNQKIGGIFSLSGPAVARQMAQKNFTVMNIAGDNKNGIKKIKNILENDYLRLVEIKDKNGLEVVGSFKNVYTIAIGLCDGFKFDLNTKAVFVTMALKEMEKIIEQFSGDKKMILELAGIGDFIATAFSVESRNRRFGEYLAKGLNIDQAQKKIGQTIEGIEALEILMTIIKKNKIQLPLAKMIFDCVFSENKNKKEILLSYLKNNF